MGQKLLSQLADPDIDVKEQDDDKDKEPNQEYHTISQERHGFSNVVCSVYNESAEYFCTHSAHAEINRSRDGETVALWGMMHADFPTFLLS